MIQWNPGYDDPYALICEAAGARRGRRSQGSVVHQKGAWMKREKGEEEEEEEEEEERVIQSERATKLAICGKMK